jgi:hyperosmotically inducible periplasmic protein
MKKTLKLSLAVVAMLSMLTFTACKKKPKPEDIEKAAMAKLAGMGDMMKGGAVSFKDGVLIVSGECKDAKCKDECIAALKAAKIDGVKDVVSNCTIAPVVPTLDPMKVTAANKILAGLKDFPGVSSVMENGVLKLSGTVDKAKAMIVKQIGDKAATAGGMKLVWEVVSK